jgi:hypothetical protein
MFLSTQINAIQFLVQCFKTLYNLHCINIFHIEHFRFDNKAIDLQIMHLYSPGLKVTVVKITQISTSHFQVIFGMHEGLSTSQLKSEVFRLPNNLPVLMTTKISKFVTFHSPNHFSIFISIFSKF